MLQLADYRLGDLLGIAGATIGIIIAGGIFLQTLSMRYAGVFERYRLLTSELRQHAAHDARHKHLQAQVVCFRRQIKYLNCGTLIVALAVLAFLLTVAVASMAVMFPRDMIFRVLGTIGLFAGLALIAAAVALLVLETLDERRTIHQESGDIEDLPSLQEADQQ